MAVIFDAKGTSDLFTNTPGGSPIDFTNLTIGTLDNRAIVAFLSYFSSTGSQIGSVTSTWDNGGTNLALSLIGSELNYHTFNYLSFWAVVAPTSGNKTLRFTTTSGMTEVYTDAVSLGGVDQRGGAFAFKNFTSNNSETGTNTTVTVTCSLGDIVLGFHGQAGSTPTITSVNNTQIYIDNDGPADVHTAANYALGVNGSINMTSSFGSSTPWGAIGLDIGAAILPLIEPMYMIRRRRIVGGIDRPWESVASWFYPSGWVVQGPQPPRPITSRKVWAGATMKGDDGNQATFIRFVTSAWQVQPPQPPAPASFRKARSSATMKGHDDGTQNVYSYFASRPDAVLPIFSKRRVNAFQAELSLTPFLLFDAARWLFDTSTIAPRRRRVAAIEIEPFIHPIAPQVHGYDLAPTLFFKKRIGFLDSQQDIGPPLLGPYRPWWEAISIPLLRPSRRPGQAPDIILFPFPRVLWVDRLMKDLRRPGARRVAEQYRYIEKHFLTPTYGWQVQPPQPQARQSRASMYFRGDDGTVATMIVPFKEGWKPILFFPPHPRPERSASIAIGDVGAWAQFVDLLVSGVVVQDAPVWNAVAWDELA